MARLGIGGFDWDAAMARGEVHTVSAAPRYPWSMTDDELRSRLKSWKSDSCPAVTAAAEGGAIDGPAIVAELRNVRTMLDTVYASERDHAYYIQLADMIAYCLDRKTPERAKLDSYTLAEKQAMSREELESLIMDAIASERPAPRCDCGTPLLYPDEVDRGQCPICYLSSRCYVCGTPIPAMTSKCDSCKAREY